MTAASFVRGWVKAAKGMGVGYQMSGIRGYPNIRSSVKATDDKTLTVQLSRPDCQFPARAANPVFSPLPEEDAETAKPIGNGPFMVESATLGQNVVLARWDDYAIGDKAYLDKVELLVADTPEVALEGATAVSSTGCGSADRRREARDEHAPKGNWISREMFGYTGMVPMVKNKPFTSAAARKPSPTPSTGRSSPKCSTRAAFRPPPD